MIPVVRFLQRATVPRSRALFSTSTSTPTSSEGQQTAKDAEEEFVLDMSKFVDSIGMDVRSTNKGQSFAKMLRDSKLMQLGDINGRVVFGNIVHRMQDDLYIDFGLKFNAVCKAPAVNGEDYRVGSRVLIRLHDAELSEKFLGSQKDLTLLEADATLIVHSARKAPTKREQQPEPTESAQKVVV